MREPFLSLVIGCRNDNYGGDSRWRLETTLNYLASNLSKLGRLSQVEVVLADWGSEVPLHKVMALTADAWKLMRCIVVPPDVAQERGGDSEFPVVLTQNTGIRRARGRFVAQMDADILLDPIFLDGLFSVLDGRLDLGVPLERALLVAQRKQVPYLLTAAKPSTSQIEWLIGRFGAQIPVDLNAMPYFGTGFIMMHRGLWDQCGGFDEKLIYRGAMEVDLGKRITKQYPCVLLNLKGMHVYHLCHYTVFSAITAPRKHNRLQDPSAFAPNGPDWGLAECALEEHRGQDRVRQSEEPNRAGGAGAVTPRFLARVALAMAVLKVGRLVPVSFWRTFGQFLWLFGRLRLLLSGVPIQRWPASLWAFWTQRRARLASASSGSD